MEDNEGVVPIIILAFAAILFLFQFLMSDFNYIIVLFTVILGIIGNVLYKSHEKKVKLKRENAEKIAKEMHEKELLEQDRLRNKKFKRKMKDIEEGFKNKDE